jgi:hypothetical protein
MLRRAVFSVAVLVAALACSGSALAGPSLFVGVSDDYLKSEPEDAAAAIRQIGLSAVRVTLEWRPGQRTIAFHDVAGLQKALGAGSGARIIAAVYPDNSSDVPRDERSRDDYCSTVRSILERFPTINDVVIGNEPNKSTFWKPQFNADGTSSAPVEYARLLAHCYSLLHAFRPTINVIHAGLSSSGNDNPFGSGNISHSPGAFIRKEGEALRAGLLGAGPVRLFDTFAMHPYGESSTEAPWKEHLSSTFAIGDWHRLMQALYDAFAGTTQPVPGGLGGSGRSVSAGGHVGIWYLEMGFQTSIAPSEVGSYRGAENVDTVPDGGAYQPFAGSGGVPDQGTQLVNAVRLAYCQPYVDAIFNFLLKDEPDLARWQSGLIWYDWTPKSSSVALAQVIQEVKARRVDCSRLPGGPVKPFKPKTSVDVRRVMWPKQKSFFWSNDLWRFRVQANENVSYTAKLYRTSSVGSRRPSGQPIFTASGNMKMLYLTWVLFPRKVLPAGSYVIEVVLRSKESSARATRIVSPTLVVKPKP